MRSLSAKLFGPRVFYLALKRIRLSHSRIWRALRLLRGVDSISETTKQILILSSFLVLTPPLYAQSTASIEGLVSDQQGGVIPRAEVTASCPAIGVKRTAETDVTGRYQLAALPVGEYRLEIRANGFKEQLLLVNRVEVGRRLIQNVQLQVGNISEQVTVNSRNGMIEQTTVSVGHVIDRRMVQEPSSSKVFPVPVTLTFDWSE